MPCNCSGVRVRSCRCELVPKGCLGTTQDLVLVRGIQKPSFVFRLMEALYEKCAAYNLRYCPFSGVMRRDKYLRSTLKDIIVLLCFLVANFIVFLNIIIKTIVHVYLVLKETASWIRSRSLFKSECNEPFYFEQAQCQLNYMAFDSYDFIQPKHRTRTIANNSCKTM